MMTKTLWGSIHYWLAAAERARAERICKFGPIGACEFGEEQIIAGIELKRLARKIPSPGPDESMASWSERTRFPCRTDSAYALALYIIELQHRS